MASEVTMTLDPKATKELLSDLQFKAATKEAVVEGLDIIQNEQIEDYGQNSNPPKPTGSNYERTFGLRESSFIRERSIAGGHEGFWRTTGRAEYDTLIIGTKTQQAAIHRGRWLSHEEIVENTTPKIIKKTREIVNKHARKI